MRSHFHLKTIFACLCILLPYTLSCRGEEKTPISEMEPELVGALKKCIADQKDIDKLTGNIIGLYYLLDLEIAKKLDALDPSDRENSADIATLLGICGKGMGSKTAKSIIRHLRYVPILTSLSPASDRGCPEAGRPAFDVILEHCSPELIKVSILEIVKSEWGVAFLDDPTMSLVLGRLWIHASVAPMPPWLPKEDVKSDEIRKQALEMLQARKWFYESKGKDEAENLKRIIRLIEVVLRTPITVMDLKE